MRLRNKYLIVLFELFSTFFFYYFHTKNIQYSHQNCYHKLLLFFCFLVILPFLCEISILLLISIIHFRSTFGYVLFAIFIRELPFLYFVSCALLKYNLTLSVRSAPRSSLFCSFSLTALSCHNLRVRLDNHSVLHKNR